MPVGEEMDKNRAQRRRPEFDIGVGRAPPCIGALSSDENSPMNESSKGLRIHMLPYVIVAYCPLFRFIKATTTIIAPDTDDPAVPPAPRRPLFQAKAKPSTAKQLKCSQPQQQPCASSTSDYGGGGCGDDDWESISQIAASSSRGGCGGSLIDRSSRHVCPLSEKTLLSGYESESPDEVALVKTACKYGCKLLQRGGDFVVLWLPGKLLIFQT